MATISTSVPATPQPMKKEKPIKRGPQVVFGPIKVKKEKTKEKKKGK